MVCFLAACGRLGFEADSQRDGAIADADADADAVVDGMAATDAVVTPPATIAFVGSTRTTANQDTYVFPGVAIGAPSPGRIVVVCAYLGGGATTPITSITVGGAQLSLVGVVVDPINGGSWAIGYKTIAAALTADISVTSVGAGRAAIAIYNVTAMSEAPTESQVQQNPVVGLTPIGATVDLRAGEVVIANAGHGSNNVTWTWSGSWTNYFELVDEQWGEQGSYTSASATSAADGPRTLIATPSGNTAKMFNVATWR